MVTWRSRQNRIDMRDSKDEADDQILALLQLTTLKNGPIKRVWEGQYRQSLDRLFEKGYLVDPRTKAQSVVLTNAGREKARALFHRQFGLGERDGTLQETVNYGYQLGLVTITPPGYIPR
jgi:Domain of unknown function (DUF6429)